MKIACLTLLATVSALARQLVEVDLPSEFVPKPVPIAVLLPDGHDKSSELPVLILLHGGGGDRRYLTSMRPVIEEMWKSGALPKMIVATPSVTSRCFYMDFKDGSERWEQFIVHTLLRHLEANFGASKSSLKRFIAGISMGGMGSLRIAFKHPDLFGAVSSMEPGIEPILKWSEMQPRHRFWRDDTQLETAFGKPEDPIHWEANNPASIAKADAKKLRDAGLQIYIECGNEDNVPVE